MKNNKKVFLAGHNGLVGRSILNALLLKKIKTITASRSQLDLRDQKKVTNFLKRHKPNGVIIAAARVGGIKANNTFRSEFIYDNLMIQTNLIHASYLAGVKNLIFLGSSCVYPKNCKQPIVEKDLLSGFLEKTNEPYAVAKIAGIKMCENYTKQYKLNYKSLMPCNSFGENDNYDLETSHFLPALIKKVALAKKNNIKKIELWGNGSALREVIHSDEIANACLFFLYKKIKSNMINIGSGYEKTIKEYLKIIMQAAKYKCRITYKNKNLKGTPRKIMNSSIAKKYGWKLKSSTKDKIIEIYNSFEKKIIS